MNILKTVKTIIIVLLVGSLIHYFSVNAGSIKDIVFRVNIRDFMLLTAFMLVTYVISSFSLYVVLNARQPTLSWAGVFRFFIMKKLINMHLPQSGHVYEAIRLKQKYDVKFIDYAASFTVVTWVTAAFNVFLAMAFYLYLVVFDHKAPDYLLFLFLAGVFLVLLFLPYILHFLTGMLRSIFREDGKFMILGNLELLSSTIKNDLIKRKVVLLLAVSMVANFLAMVGYIYYGLGSIGSSLEFAAVIPFVVLSVVLGLVNIVPGNIGINEYAYGFLGNMYFLDFSVGIILSLVFRLSGYVSILICALCMPLLAIAHGGKGNPASDE